PALPDVQRHALEHENHPVINHLDIVQRQHVAQVRPSIPPACRPSPVTTPRSAVVVPRIKRPVLRSSTGWRRRARGRWWRWAPRDPFMVWVPGGLPPPPSTRSASISGRYFFAPASLMCLPTTS